MIQSKQDLKTYLEQDKKSLGIEHLRPQFFGDEIWKFQRALRYQEYFHNCGKNFLHKLAYIWHKLRTRSLAKQLGYTISINTCGPGLHLPHRGTIVINDQAKIGKNCKIHVCVNIGAHKGKAPKIGNNVYIGPGAKIFGDIEIADDASIGANAVVNQSFTTPGAVIVGPLAIELAKKNSN